MFDDRAVSRYYLQCRDKRYISLLGKYVARFGPPIICYRNTLLPKASNALKESHQCEELHEDYLCMMMTENPNSRERERKFIQRNSPLRPKFACPKFLHVRLLRNSSVYLNVRASGEVYIKQIWHLVKTSTKEDGSLWTKGCWEKPNTLASGKVFIKQMSTH